VDEVYRPACVSWPRDCVTLVMLKVTTKLLTIWQWLSFSTFQLLWNVSDMWTFMNRVKYSYKCTHTHTQSYILGFGRYQCLADFVAGQISDFVFWPTPISLPIATKTQTLASYTTLLNVVPQSYTSLSESVLALYSL